MLFYLLFYVLTYLNLLCLRSRIQLEEDRPTVYAMNTHFLERMQKDGYSGVSKWTKCADIFYFDIILVPVLINKHWTIAMIHIKEKSIKYYDSIGGQNDALMTKLAEYLQFEHLQKKKVALDTCWVMENVRNIPQQKNRHDCGVFICMYAEYVTRNRPIAFEQQHMQYFRMKMVYEICTKQIQNEIRVQKPVFYKQKRPKITRTKNSQWPTANLNKKKTITNSQVVPKEKKQRGRPKKKVIANHFDSN